MTQFIFFPETSSRSPHSAPSAEHKRSASKLAWLVIASIALLPALESHSLAHADSLGETAEKYRPYLVEGIDQALTGARALQARVAAKDLPGAKAAWLSARAGWERSEVFTGGFVPDLDEKIDAWPNATAGFHAIEARLFGANQTDVEADTNSLVDHLVDLRAKAHDMTLAPQGILNGTAQLVYEVGESKSDGGESRISGTSLDDMRSNLAGIETAYDIVFASAIQSSDPKLVESAHRDMAELKTLLAVPELKNIDTIKLRQVTEELVINLQNSAPKIGLGRPSLESTP